MCIASLYFLLFQFSTSITLAPSQSISWQVKLACTEIPLLESSLLTALLCSFILTASVRPVSPMYCSPQLQPIWYTTPLMLNGSTLFFTLTNSLLSVLRELKTALTFRWLHCLSIFSLKPGWLERVVVCRCHLMCCFSSCLSVGVSRPEIMDSHWIQRFVANGLILYLGYQCCRPFSLCVQDTSQYQTWFWMDRYLNYGSNHHPKIKSGIVKCLAHRARTVCSIDTLGTELDHLQQTFESNDYPLSLVSKHLQTNRKKNNTLNDTDKPPPVLVTPA